MAISSGLVKEWYKDKSVKELEELYKELEKDYCFNSKEEQISYMIENFLNASHDVNITSTREGLEELLKEKTGKDYKIKTKMYKVSLMDFTDYIANKKSVNKDILIKFFDRIEWPRMYEGLSKYKDAIIDREKSNMLLCLFLDEKTFPKFIKDLQKAKDYQKLFKKYYEIADDFYSNNRYIC